MVAARCPLIRHRDCTDWKNTSFHLTLPLFSVCFHYYLIHDNALSNYAFKICQFQKIWWGSSSSFILFKYCMVIYFSKWGQWAESWKGKSCESFVCLKNQIIIDSGSICLLFIKIALWALWKSSDVKENTTALYEWTHLKTFFSFLDVQKHHRKFLEVLTMNPLREIF